MTHFALLAVLLTAIARPAFADPEPPRMEPTSSGPISNQEAVEDEEPVRGSLASPKRIERGSVPLEVTVGAGVVVTTPGPLERVALADEKLAQVQVLSKREVMLNGTEAGKTTLFLWLKDGRRFRYVVVVRRDIGFVSQVVSEVDERIEAEVSPDGHSVVLRGEVDSASTAELAVARAAAALHGASDDAGKLHVINLIRFPTVIIANADERLQRALDVIDSRIRARRIQVGDSSEVGKDTYLLEGHVRTVSALMRAITVADRQLGGSGNKIIAGNDSPRHSRDRQSGSGVTGTSHLNGFDPPPPGLAAQLARGLVLSSESGKVVSFLKVDDLHQVQVSIRVIEIDRSRARSLGISYRIDANNFSIAGLHSPGGALLGAVGGRPASVSGFGGGNLVGAYVDDHRSIGAAVEALEQAQIARSVAEPSILTLSGEEATVLIGGEVPIPTAAVGQITTIQSVAFREFGVRLDIRPTVSEDEIIALEVSPSIARIDPGIQISAVPGFQIQSVQTTARVKAGQSLVIGGLLSFEERTQTRKVPFLGDIPIINAAFRWQSKTRQERELLFVITPRLVSTDGTAAPIELPERNLRAPQFGAPPSMDYNMEERRKYDPRNYEVAPKPRGDSGFSR